MVRLVMPSTKHIASRMLDLPEPFLRRRRQQKKPANVNTKETDNPVIALNEASHPDIDVRTGYDLKPSKISSVTRIVPSQAARASFNKHAHPVFGE